MNIIKIEENVKNLIAKINSGELAREDFIYELLLGYGHRPQTIGRVRSGERNLADDKVNSVFWKRQIYFQIAEEQNLYDLIDQMKNEKRVKTNKIRFLVATDLHKFLAVDTKTQDSLDIDFIELPKKFDFFLPWAGMEKAIYQGENPADVKAAEKLARLFDEIKADNFDKDALNDKEKLHHLNIFLSRLLFCYFAEDTGIFGDKQFSDAVGSHTKDDGSDLSDYLKRLFSVLNESNEQRQQELPSYLSEFPYVNGGLFKDNIEIPDFTKKSRRILIECGAELDWSDINPDIFGSMFQAVVHTDQRSDMGQHYTSVPNIMKVIEPLFLNDLYDELGKNENSISKLMELQLRLEKIKIFDPACGSGNFLIIAYKELRKFEMEVLKRMQEIELEKTRQFSKPFSVLQVSQFYGIELDDFACEVATLSLWLAEHQMNMQFKDEFGESLPSLPLRASGNIVCGNATTLTWSDICQREGSEVYVIGNPPYLGYSLQNNIQKREIEGVFSTVTSRYKELDYICCWLFKGALYIRNYVNVQLAFVSTNSIGQGEQVAMLWPHILKRGIEISFVHSPFKWSNNAQLNAGVTVVVVGLRNILEKPKYIYTDFLRRKVNNISPYLLAGDNTIVEGRSKPLSAIPKMILGSMAKDNGQLFISEEEYNKLKIQNNDSLQYVKRAIGSSELINGRNLWCLWIEDNDLEIAGKIPFIKERLENVVAFREKSKALSTRKYSIYPHRFMQRTHQDTDSMIIPRVCSERREYLTVGFLSKDFVIKDSAYAIYQAKPYMFGLLSSKMHMAWTKRFSGKLEERIRYSSMLVYNTFPIPFLTEKMLETMTSLTFEILSIRESYSSKSLAELYDPEKMPRDLLSAHKNNDEYIDQLYSKDIFNTDEDRLDCLLKLYEKMKNKKGR